MGQMTVGVVYGVREPKGVDLYGNDDSLAARYADGHGHAPQADQGNGLLVCALGFDVPSREPAAETADTPGLHADAVARVMLIDQRRHIRPEMGR